MATSSFFARAFPASIFIILSVTCVYLMDVVGLIIKYPQPASTGSIEWSNGKVPILDKFHWLSFLDIPIRDVTVGFAPSSFGYDSVSRWQMMNFLMDVGVFYMAWGLEGLRHGVKSGPVYYPGIFALVAQFLGGGVVIALYYFAYLAYTPPMRIQPLSERKIDIGGSAIWALLVFAFDVVPVFGLMFDSTFEARHWWTWFWQLYSVRITISWYLLQFLFRFVPLPSVESTLNYRTKITLILGPFIAMAAATWIYTLISCPHPLSIVFFPQTLVEDTWVLRMRRILQYDQLFVFGASVLWIAMDARRNKISSGLGVVLLGSVLACLLGTGASFGILWLIKENLVSSKTEELEEKSK